jgi:hypothetical protein
LVALGDGVSSLSTSVSGCGVAEVASKLDALAAAVKWANVSGLDGAVKVLVGAADLEKDLQALGAAIQSGDSTAVGNALGALLDQWTAVAGGCSSKTCSFVDGILRVVQTVATDYAACDAAIEPAYAQFQAGVAAMHGKNVSGAVQDFASGLDVLAKALADDSCGLAKLADVLSKIAPKLAAAVVKDDSVVVGYANVYDELFAAAVAVEDGDAVAFGMAVGRMLQSLRASNCQTKFCVVLQGILARCSSRRATLPSARPTPTPRGTRSRPPSARSSASPGSRAPTTSRRRSRARPRPSATVACSSSPRSSKTRRPSSATPPWRPRSATSCPFSWRAPT